MNIAITGGSRGIGRATAEACARAGMSVAIGDLDGTQCAEVAAEIGPRVIGLPLDVCDPASFDSFLSAAEDRHGALDAVVNNAGVASVGPFKDERPTDTQRMLDVNIGGVITGTRLAMERFLPRRRGHVVNLASTAGVAAPAGSATYSATKHAVVGFTRAIRAETRESGMRTTIVMPSFVNTEMMTGFKVPPGVRVPSPEAVADAIVDALRSGRAELFVPREVGVISRLISGTPPRFSDGVKRLIRADQAMIDVDPAVRADYDRRIQG